ncbi:MAG: DUF1572 family protein [Planctomycetota bacterium]
MPTIAQTFCQSNSETLDQAMIKIEHCVSQLNDSQLWWRPEPSMNSIGNLILHLTGNLRQWGIVPLTMAKDRRDRASEFEENVRIGTPQLLKQIRETITRAKEEWSHVNDEQLTRNVNIQGFDVSLLHAIVHTTSHFVGHTHQIIQLTRMQLGSNYQFQWTPEEDRGDVPV